MVKARDDRIAGAGTNLDRIRDIILGASTKSYEQKFQRHENALEKARSELRDRIKATEGSVRSLSQTSRNEREELDRKLSARLDSLDTAVEALKKESCTALKTLKQEREAAAQAMNLRNGLEKKSPGQCPRLQDHSCARCRCHSRLQGSIWQRWCHQGRASRASDRSLHSDGLRVCQSVICS